MAYATKYQWDIAARRRTWNVALQQDGFTSGAGVFTVMYVALQNNAVGATNNFVAKVVRDEGNVGSWSYSLVNISQATYGGFSAEIPGVLVDEAASLMFLTFTDGNVWSFDLDGNPVTHIWTPDGTNTLRGIAIDPVADRLYLMMSNNSGGTNHGAVLREYAYDGTYIGPVWSNDFGASTICRTVAYDDGFVYFFKNGGTSNISRIEIATGTLSVVLTPITLTGGGQAVASATAGKFFGVDVGANDLFAVDIPSGGSKTTIDSATAAEDNGVAIDRLANKIYWCDDQRSIVRANLDGSSEESVIDFPPTDAGTYIYGISLGEPILAPTTLTGGRGARIIWGETTADLDSRIMPADMRLQVYDPNLTLYNELSADGVEEDDYRIVLTDSTGTYTMRFKVRLDTVRTALFTGLDVPITSLYAYCGLANLKTIDAVTLSSSTLHNAVRYVLASNVQAQDIEYIVGVWPENTHTSGAVLDLVRLNRMDLAYQEEGRKRDNAESQLRGLLEALDAALWQGMDGQWHFKHRFALGEYVTGRGPQRYIHASTSLVALSTLQLDAYQARPALFNRGATVRTDEPIQAVEIEQGVSADDRFTDVNLVRFADMENGWVSDTEHLVWQGGPSIIFRSTDSDTGTYSLQINPDTTPTIRQDLVYIAGKQPLRFILNIRFGHVYTSGGSGSGVSKVRLVWDPYDAAGAPRYATSSGWSTTPTDYTLTQTPQTFGSPVNWATETIEIVDSVPGVDALLYIQFTGDTTSNFVVRIDNIEVRLVDEGQAVENQFRAVFHRLDNNTNPATKGIVVRQRRPWHPGTLWLDTDANDLRDTAVQLVQADTTGSGGWIEAADWTSEIEGDSPTYDDLARWSAESRIEQQQNPLEVIEGEILDIIPPELAVVYSGGVYMPLYCELDLAEERTKLVLARKQRAYESLEPPDPFAVLYAAIENNEVGATHNFVAKFTRDEGNVGSWAYSLVNISQATYGTNLSPNAALEVDEAANRMFLVFDSGVMYSFELNGTPVAQVWTVPVGSSFQGFTIDTAADRLYIMTRAADNRTNTLTSYDYSGGDSTAIWSELYGSVTSTSALSFAGGFVYFREVVGAGTDAVVRVAVGTGTKTNVVGSLTLVSGTGQGAVHEGQRWFGSHSADTALYKANVPTASTYDTHDDHASAGTNGVCVDLVGFMVYWVTGQLAITRSAYDGSGEEIAAQLPAGTGTLIYGLSTGK